MHVAIAINMLLVATRSAVLSAVVKLATPATACSVKVHTHTHTHTHRLSTLQQQQQPLDSAPH